MPLMLHLHPTARIEKVRENSVVINVQSSDKYLQSKQAEGHKIKYFFILVD